MTDENPMAKLAILRDRVEEVMDELGLTMEGFAFVPADEPDGAHMAQGTFHLDPTRVFATPEDRATQDEFDATFADMAQHEREDERLARMQEVRDNLARNLTTLKQGDGIGLDEE